MSQRVRNKSISASKGLGFFSFFSGAGFLDLGFENSGYEPLMANEIDSYFSRVFTYAREKMRCAMPKYGLQTGDVNSYLDDTCTQNLLKTYIEKERKTHRFIGFIGGPPCPDFSVAGKQAGAEGKHGKLSQVYADLICLMKPDFFVFENVKGLWRTKRHRDFFDSIVQQVKCSGYAVTYRLINALEYGAAQDRDRIILIGIKKELCKREIYDSAQEFVDFPWSARMKYQMNDIRGIQWPGCDQFVENGKRSKPSDVPTELTVQYWFDKNEVEHHPNANDFFVPRAGIVKMRTFCEGDDSRKCYKRLHRWRYSPTACYGNNEVHLHPYKVRRLSVAETLAIQSLPKDFQLPMDVPLSAKFKTIGNGVPYVAAKGIAETLKLFLSENMK